jgi:hypothetical protein
MTIPNRGTPEIRNLASARKSPKEYAASAVSPPKVTAAALCRFCHKEVWIIVLWNKAIARFGTK